MSRLAIFYEETESYLRSDSFCAPIALCIEERWAEAGHETVILDPRSESADLDAVAGGVYLAGKSADMAARFRASFPVVLALPDFDDPVPPALVQNDEGMGRIAARMLLDAGRRDLAALTGQESDGTIAAPYRRRIEGFRVVAEQAGATVRVFSAPFEHINGTTGSTASKPAGDTLGIILVGEEKKPDGLFAVNDVIGHEVAVWLEEAHVGIPSQIAIIGCDNMPIDGSPVLSTMHIPKCEIGRRSAEGVLSMLDGRPVENLSIDPLFIARETTPR